MYLDIYNNFIKLAGPLFNAEPEFSIVRLYMGPGDPAGLGDPYCVPKGIRVHFKAFFTRTTNNTIDSIFKQIMPST
jgi:hypothetical protein